MSSMSDVPFSRMWPVLFMVAALLVAPGKRTHAQVLPAAAGTAGGFVAGTIVTLGIVVFKARLGHYLYGLDDLVSIRPEIFPILIGPVAGGVMGATSPATLRRAGTGALIGLAGGAAIGAGVGQIIGTTSEGTWAGGIIGGAAGMLAGSIVYALRGSGNDSGTSVPLASMSIKVPWGR